MSWQERITVNSGVCHGKACIRGTRVMVSVVLDNVAAGESVEEIMRGTISSEKMCRLQSNTRQS